MNADFLAAHSCMQELGGYPGSDGEFDGDVVRVRSRFLVFVSAAVCEWPEPSSREPVASLWFHVADEVKETRSFAVATEALIGALENLAPSRTPKPIPAVEVHDPGFDRVLAGDPLYLALRIVRVEAANDQPRLPTNGIRFEVGESALPDSPPAYSFTLEGLVPFIALSAALRDPAAGPPKTFSEELDELATEIEGAAEDDR